MDRHLRVGGTDGPDLRAMYRKRVLEYRLRVAVLAGKKDMIRRVHSLEPGWGTDGHWGWVTIEVRNGGRVGDGSQVTRLETSRKSGAR